MLGLKPEIWPGNLGEEGQGSRVKGQSGPKSMGTFH